jgi:hypothetical protein
LGLKEKKTERTSKHFETKKKEAMVSGAQTNT